MTRPPYIDILRQAFDRSTVISPSFIETLHTTMRDIELTKQECYNYLQDVLVDIEPYTVPSYIHSPPKFDPSWYPIDPLTRLPLQPHPFDYVMNCDAISFTKQMEKLQQEYEKSDAFMQPYFVMAFNMSNTTSQMSYGRDNFWLMLLCYVICLYKHPFEQRCLSLLAGLLKHYSAHGPPFNHKRSTKQSGKRVVVEFFSDYPLPVSSVLPLCLHQWMTCVEACFASEFTRDDVHHLFDQYMLICKTSPFDNQLEVRDLFLEWIPSYLADYKGGMYIPRYNEYMIINGYRALTQRDATPGFGDMKAVKEAVWITDFFKNQLLTGWKSLRNKRDVSLFYRRMLRGSMDALFIDGENLMTLEKAVTSRVIATSNPPAAKEVIVLNDETEVVLHYVDDSERYTLWGLYNSEMTQIVNSIATELAEYDFKGGWARWLTSRSGGKYEVTDEVLAGIPKDIRSLLNIRVIAEAANIGLRTGGVSVGATLSKYNKEYTAIHRLQRGRRKRVIVIGPTDVIRNNYPLYVVEVSAAYSTGCAAFSKASGTLADLAPIKFMQMRGFLIDSKDRTAFDATITFQQRMINKSIAMRALMDNPAEMMTGPDVGARIKNLETGDTSYRQLKSITYGQAVDAAFGVLQSSRVVSQAIYDANGKLVVAHTTGSTFGSGAVNTSSNHTLDNIIYDRMCVKVTNAICRNIGWQINHEALTAYLNVLGDDSIRATCNAPEEVERLFTAVHDVVHRAANVKLKGFKLKMYGDFLQQVDIAGMQIGKAARLCFHSAEDPGAIKTRLQAASTIKDTLNEYASRTTTLHNFLPLAECIIYMMYGTQTFPVVPGLDMTAYKRNAIYREFTYKDRQWIHQVIPFMWLYIRQGGGFPMRAVRTASGEVMVQRSYLARDKAFLERDLFWLCMNKQLYDETYTLAQEAVTNGVINSVFPQSIPEDVEAVEPIETVKALKSRLLPRGIISLIDMDYADKMGVLLARYMADNDPENLMSSRRRRAIEEDASLTMYLEKAKAYLNTLENVSTLERSYEAQRELLRQHLPMSVSLAITEQPKTRVTDVLLARKLTTEEYTADVKDYIIILGRYNKSVAWLPSREDVLYLYDIGYDTDGGPNENSNWRDLLEKVEGVSTECSIGLPSAEAVERLALINASPYSSSTLRNRLLDAKRLNSFSAPVLRFVEKHAKEVMSNFELYVAYLGLSQTNAQRLEQYITTMLAEGVRAYEFTAANTPRRDFSFDASVRFNPLYVRVLAKVGGELKQRNSSIVEHGTLIGEYHSTIAKDAFFKFADFIGRNRVTIDIHPICIEFLTQLQSRQMAVGR